MLDSSFTRGYLNASTQKGDPLGQIKVFGIIIQTQVALARIAIEPFEPTLAQLYLQKSRLTIHLIAEKEFLKAFDGQL